MDCPNLEKLSDKIFKSIDGYFVNKGTVWVFIPLEKELMIESLTRITNTLRYLNELQSIS